MDELQEAQRSRNNQFVSVLWRGRGRQSGGLKTRFGASKERREKMLDQKEQ